LQPQLVELAVPQHDAFSDAAQHDACLVGEQHADSPLVVAVVFSWLSVRIRYLLYIHGLVELSAHTERRAIVEKDAPWRVSR
jgi:hypothetical protein